MNNETIYDLIKQQETAYSKPVEVIEGWDWSMKEHIRRAFLYYNSQFAAGNEKRDKTPFKNIVRYILNVAFRTEGFNVKDVNFYVNDSEQFHKSYLIRKYHERWAKDNQIDTFIDELIESAVVYGAALIKNVKGIRPEVVDLASLCFADQINLLDNPFGIKHLMSLDELQNMADSGWGETVNGATISLEELIQLTREEQRKYNGKIEIYEVHGVMPEKWIDEKKQESKKYIRQVQVVAYYKNSEDKDVGVTLFKSKSPKKLFKLLKRDDIKNRALGFGGVEELFDAQVWTNYAMIRKRDFLDSASKTILKTTDSTLVNKHPSGLKDLDNLEIVEVAEGKDLNQVDTFPRNWQVFDNSVNEWEQHAKTTGSANDPLLGEIAPSGTPFRAQERQVIEGKGIHEYRKEKFARFVEELYREWIVPQMSKEIQQGVKFLAELDLDVLQRISENMSILESNNFIKEKILNGELIDSQEVETLKQQTKNQFLKGGKKRFMEVLKNEMQNAPLEVEVDVAGKTKDLGAFADRLSKVVLQIMANPQGFAQMMQIPAAAKAFNDMMEASGLNSVELGDFAPPIQQPQPQTGQPQMPQMQQIQNPLPLTQ